MSEETKPLNFIEHIIEEDLANGMPKGKVTISLSTRT
jgi:glutaminyl-tRNA synthetase